MELLYQVLLSGLIWGSIYALIAIGLALIWGVMDIVNFAHGDFLVVGMYVAFSIFAATQLDPIISAPIAGLVLFVVGMLTYILIIRRVEGASLLIQIVATFAIGLFLRNLMQLIFKTDYLLINNEKQSFFNEYVTIFGANLNSAQLATAIISILAAGVFFLLVYNTKMGRAMLAVSENPYAAKLMGINITKINIIAWGISASIVGISGALLSKFYYIFPTSGSHFGLLSFIIVAMGGFKSMGGAFIAGITVGVVEAVAGFASNSSLKVAFIFLIYIAVVLIRPKGFLGR
jgi:branched-chain amino acid transport system permease protein